MIEQKDFIPSYCKFRFDDNTCEIKIKLAEFPTQILCDNVTCSTYNCPLAQRFTKINTIDAKFYPASPKTD